MSKYTPGPWTATPCHVRAPETEDRLALDVQINGGNRADNKANGRLIAAAPDLLEALEETLKAAIDWIDEARGCTPEHLMTNDWYYRALAAIEKATGRKP